MVGAWTTMRQGKWELQVIVDGAPLKEYDVDGHTVVAAQPGKTFTVVARYLGEEMHGAVLLIDGKQTSGRQIVDATGTTTFPKTSINFNGWKKSSDGRVVVSAFVFEPTLTQEGNSCDWGDGGTDWSRGVFTLQVHAGVHHVVKKEGATLGHAPDLSHAGAVSEKELIKGGFSASAGAGAKTFRSTFIWRQGMSNVGRAPGDPLLAEVKIHYRDNLFLSREGLEGFAWAEAAGSSSAPGPSGLRAVAAPRQAKRPRGDEPETIDLTVSDDENGGGAVD